MNVRYAVYFIPGPDTALAALGSALLGRDSETGRKIPHMRLPGFSLRRVHDLTADPRRYGLHATLKAPFFVKQGMTERDLLRSAARFVTGRQSILLPRLALARISSFFALIPSVNTPEEQAAVQCVNALAADAVSFFDPFRAAPSEQERARREQPALTMRQRTLLAEWGYPYVFDEYRFHITLTGTLRDSVVSHAVEESLRGYCEAACCENIAVAGICVCRQVNDRPFMLLQRFCFQDYTAVQATGFPPSRE